MFVYYQWLSSVFIVLSVQLVIVWSIRYSRRSCLSGLPCRAVPCRALPCRAVPCRAVPCLALPVYLSYVLVLCSCQPWGMFLDPPCCVHCDNNKLSKQNKIGKIVWPLSDIFFKSNKGKQCWMEITWPNLCIKIRVCGIHLLLKDQITERFFGEPKMALRYGMTVKTLRDPHIKSRKALLANYEWEMSDHMKVKRFKGHLLWFTYYSLIMIPKFILWNKKCIFYDYYCKIK